MYETIREDLDEIGETDKDEYLKRMKNKKVIEMSTNEFGKSMSKAIRRYVESLLSI